MSSWATPPWHPKPRPLLSVPRTTADILIERGILAPVASNMTAARVRDPVARAERAATHGQGPVNPRRAVWFYGALTDTAPHGYLHHYRNVVTRAIRANHVSRVPDSG